MNTDQAFIDAYEKTARQQQLDSGAQAINHPHAPFKPSGKSKAPLSELLAKHKQTIENAEAQSTQKVPDVSGVIDTELNTAGLGSQPEVANLAPQVVVTKFPWPSEVTKLATNLSSTLTGILDQVMMQKASTLGLSSTRRSVGLTTMTLALARTAINRGARVAMIDLTENQSGIVSRFGFEQIPSIEETTRRGLSLDQAVITSKEEQAFLMLGGKPMPKQATQAIIHRLGRSFDLILIEAGIAGSTERTLDQWLEPVEGSSLLIDLASNRLNAPRSAAADYLMNSGGNFLGVLENFV